MATKIKEVVGSIKDKVTGHGKEVRLSYLHPRFQINLCATQKRDP
jgi:hypothetical protein